MLDCLVSFTNVGVACSVEVPVERMKIEDVVTELHAIKARLLEIEEASSVVQYEFHHSNLHVIIMSGCLKISKKLRIDCVLTALSFVHHFRYLAEGDAWETTCYAACVSSSDHVPASSPQPQRDADH
ncbi:hypothetical protein V6N11_035979 [Hibiscus sabdariffa]|uniref:Uncharacterized protein n=1 Tax=Hibiscus sabdariffa TaxID=183260 RepID=A0ABR2R910_9ROSI